MTNRKIKTNNPIIDEILENMGVCELINEEIGTSHVGKINYMRDGLVQTNFFTTADLKEFCDKLSVFMIKESNEE